MSDIVSLVGALDGIGGLLQTFSCAEFIKRANKYPRITIAARKEVFEPLSYLYGDIHKCIEFQDDSFLKDEKIIEELRNNCSEFYVNWPDALFRNPYAFDYRKYNTTPSLIKSTRTLLNKWKPEKIIYFALATSTEGYLYNNIGALIRKTAQNHPDYLLYFPKVNVWAGKQLDFGDLSNMPQNVFIHENPEFIESINWMFKSDFAITTCNGPASIFYHLGCPRLLLDPQYNNPPFVARWKQDNNECISINNSITDVANLMKTLIEIPETQLLPRQLTLNMLYSNCDFSKSLIFKY